MSPASSLFLLAETREHPMHVGGLELFVPPDGADAVDVRDMFLAAVATGEAAPLYRKRARRSLSSLGQWGWEPDEAFDLEHHVRASALPRPGRVLDLLSLCSRLHSGLLDRHRPLWEVHLIEGLADGRFALYFKVHHALVDGVAALRLLSRQLSPDPATHDQPAPWAVGPAEPAHPAEPTAGAGASGLSDAALRLGRTLAAEGAGLLPALNRTVRRAMNEQAGALSFSAPQSIFNVPITGARRFAAQSWPIERIRTVARTAGTTLNDVVLALCSGALREYLIGLDALPESSLIAMVPVSLRGRGARDHSGADGRGDGGGNAVGAVMCRLGTDLADPAQRLATVRASMLEGKESMTGMTPTQVMLMSAVGLSPLALYPLLGLTGIARPPFNLVISNVPGPRRPMFWNGARLDGLYPLSIPLDGQALNITCTSYSDQFAVGLTGCRRTVPHLQRLLSHLDDELAALEKATGA
jgi:diacylglycerol O-acyltransferase / wax synthase